MAETADSLNEDVKQLLERGDEGLFPMKEYFKSIHLHKISCRVARKQTYMSPYKITISTEKGTLVVECQRHGMWSVTFEGRVSFLSITTDLDTQVRLINRGVSLMME